MSKPFSPERTNRTPWMDYILLIKENSTKDADGYEQKSEPTEREICCTFFEGVVRSEFYEAAKAGVKLSATVEIWEDDYQQEELLQYGDDSYHIRRSFPTGRGTLMLYLEEVTR